LPEPLTDYPTFDLVVPVFNEEDGLPDFFRRLEELQLNYQLNYQLILVDNASTDGSLTLLKNHPTALVIEHEKNEGYGGSMTDGINAGQNEWVITIDADCEYPPECIPAVLDALSQHSVVYASRFLDPQLMRASGMPLIKRLGNRLFSWSYNRRFTQRTTDLYTGCKGIRRSALEGIVFEQKGFEYVLELAAKLAAKGHLIYDIPVQFEARSSGASKMHYLSESTKYFWLLMRYARQHRRGTLCP
jgi:glycosyltransferase involved in cell wall biosynthesis